MAAMWFASTTSGGYAFALPKGTLLTLRLPTIIKRTSEMIKNGLPRIHPGEFLAEILEDFGVSQAEFARAIGVSPMRISYIVNGRRSVSADIALLFAEAFDQSPEYWLNLQAAYDLKTARKEIRPKLKTVRKFVALDPSLDDTALH